MFASALDAAAVGPVLPPGPEAGTLQSLIFAKAVEGDGDRYRLGDLYAERQYRPLWLDDGHPSPAVREIALRMATSRVDGLDPRNYPLPTVAVTPAQAPSEEQIASADLAISKTLLRFASDLRNGRLAPAAVDRKWDIDGDGFDAVAWLSEALGAGDPVAALDGLVPAYPVYGHLRRQLSLHREMQAAGGWPAFPRSGPRKLQLGDRHPQVPLLRDRLAVTDGPVIEPAAADTDLFDAGLDAALKRFQERHGLNQDGVLGFRTRQALAVPVDERITQLEAALERWRWMPRDLGESHILVNVPAATLWIVEDDAPVHAMRTIVGKYKRQTPTFSAEMSYLVLNPKWYVPNRIAVEDLVPKAQEDPEYYQRAGFKIYDKESGEPVDPAVVDWTEYGKNKEMPFRLVQNSGTGNALGSIKFMFKNPYGVYLHDTSSPRLFKRDARAFSSGCIRVEEPLVLASSILSKVRSQAVSAEEVDTLIKSAPTNRHLTLERKIPLYVVYMTAWADAHKAYFFDDIYRRDKKLLAALKSE